MTDLRQREGRPADNGAAISKSLEAVGLTEFSVSVSADTGPAALTKLQWQKHLRGAPLTHSEYRVLMTISTYTDARGLHAHPGWDRIAEDANVDRRTARRAVKALIRFGWLTLTAKGGNAVAYRAADEYALGTPAHPKGVNTTPLDRAQTVHKGDNLTPLAGVQSSPQGGQPRPSKGGGNVLGRGVSVAPHQITTSDPPSDPSKHHSSSPYVTPARENADDGKEIAP